MKTIALDLDGVIFDSENLYRVLSEIYDVDVHKKDTIIDNTKRTFQKRYNWESNEFQNFYQDNYEFVLSNAHLMTGADIVINKLKDKFNLIVITARSDFETEIAKEKLESIGLGDIKIFNNEHEKLNKLIEEKVDYIIDDDENICLNAANNNICALYFKNNASNRIDNVKNVVNVNNWGEIYKFLIIENNLLD